MKYKFLILILFLLIPSCQNSSFKNSMPEQPINNERELNIDLKPKIYLSNPLNNAKISLEKNSLFKIQARIENGCKFYSNSDIKWFSTNPGVVEVDSFGTLLALSIGNSTILGSYKDNQISFQVSVIESKNLNVQKFEIDQSNISEVKSNFGFMTFYNNSGSGMGILHIYDHKIKKLFSYNDTSFLRWSSNKNKVFISNNRSIYLMNIDGSEKVKINNIDLSQYHQFDVSPDEKRVILHSLTCKNAFTNLSVYYLNSNNILQLTNQTDKDKKPPVPEGRAPNTILPIWSPNENKVIFTATHSPISNILKFKPDNTNINLLSSLDIFLIDIDNLTIERITKDEDYEINPQWSPDGKKILFETRIDNSGKIKVLNLIDGKITDLTPNSKADFDLKWFSNNKISFFSNRNGGFDLFTINDNGTGVKQLTQDIIYYSYVWSENDKKVLLNKDNKQIIQINEDGSNKKILLTLLEKENGIVELF
jgi:Tol biopolymer transport system component